MAATIRRSAQTHVLEFVHEYHMSLDEGPHVCSACSIMQPSHLLRRSL